jgi:hypothetical protein
MAEYAAKRDPNRFPTHPGELLREDVIPATGKTRSEIAVRLRKRTKPRFCETKPILLAQVPAGNKEVERHNCP